MKQQADKSALLEWMKETNKTLPDGEPYHSYLLTDEILSGDEVDEFLKETAETILEIKNEHPELKGRDVHLETGDKTLKITE